MRVLSLAVVVALTSVACGDDNPTSPTPTVSSVTVEQERPEDTVFIGFGAFFQARLTQSNGEERIVHQGAWGSDNP